MTPYELNIHLKDYNDKYEREHDFALSLVYLGEKWHRYKKLPSFNELLQRDDASKHDKAVKRQSPEEMKQKLIALNASFGGSVY